MSLVLILFLRYFSANIENVVSSLNADGGKTAYFFKDCNNLKDVAWLENGV